MGKVTKLDIVNSKKIKRWIASLKSDSSKVRYLLWATDFFLFVDEKPDRYLIDDYEFLEVIEKKKVAHKYKKDLKDFKNKLINEPNKYGYDNKDSSNYTVLSCIKSMFTYNEIEFTTSFWRNLNNFKPKSVSIKKTPSQEELRKILDNTDLQGKCLFLIMATSGSRISATLNLRKKDIELNHFFPRVTFHYKHSKNRITKIKRISPECKRYLINYFDKNNFKDDDRIFLMTRQNANYKWNCALDNANLLKKNENTPRATMTTQCLKRFFKTNFSKANFENIQKWTNYFSDHESLLNIIYDDSFNDEKYKDEIYSKGVKHLLIYEKSYDTDTRIKQLQKNYDEERGKTKVLFDRVNVIEPELNAIKNDLKKFFELDNSLEHKFTSYIKSNIKEIFKNENNREPTEEECIEIEKKFNELKTSESIIKFLAKNSNL